jgi:hypothetical protein
LKNLAEMSIRLHGTPKVSDGGWRCGTRVSIESMENRTL